MLLGGLPIAEYIEGQDRPEDYAEECAKLMYYYNCKTRCIVTGKLQGIDAVQACNAE